MHVRGRDVAEDASPAHAGMDRTQAARPSQSARFPRTRGDGPILSVGYGFQHLLPPHTRGWTASLCHDGKPFFASPAHAGMDPAVYGARDYRECFPRTRGDGPDSRTPLDKPHTLPPHTRGWTQHIGGFAEITCASPAHAGMDRDGGKLPGR